MDHDLARIRNLKVKLFHKYLIDKDYLISNRFSAEDIRNELFFKQNDLSEHLPKLFDEHQNTYTIKGEIVSELDTWVSKREEAIVDQERYEQALNTGYLELTKAFSDFNLIKSIADKISETSTSAAKLHFIYLPIFDERTIMNRGILPESNPEDYYKHFHTIEDLYDVIFKNSGIKWNTVEGDGNLNQTMKMRVYSNRWGHEDIYLVRRLKDGWNFKHLSYDEKCEKDGTKNESSKDGFFKILNHDSIQYSFESISKALEQLWEIADTEDMSITSLEEKLQDIGDWISGVEKESRRLMPSWFDN